MPILGISALVIAILEAPRLSRILATPALVIAILEAQPHFDDCGSGYTHLCSSAAFWRLATFESSGDYDLKKIPYKYYEA